MKTAFAAVALFVVLTSVVSASDFRPMLSQNGTIHPMTNMELGQWKDWKQGCPGIGNPFTAGATPITTELQLAQWQDWRRGTPGIGNSFADSPRGPVGASGPSSLVVPVPKLNRPNTTPLYPEAMPNHPGVESKNDHRALRSETDQSNQPLQSQAQNGGDTQPLKFHISVLYVLVIVLAVALLKRSRRIKALEDKTKNL